MFFYTRFEMRGICNHLVEGMDENTGCFIQSIGETEFIIWVKTSFSIHRSSFYAGSPNEQGELNNVYKWIGEYLYKRYNIMVTNGCNEFSIPERFSESVKSRCTHILPYLNI